MIGDANIRRDVGEFFNAHLDAIWLSSPQWKQKNRIGKPSLFTNFFLYATDDTVSWPSFSLNGCSTNKAFNLLIRGDLSWLKGFTVVGRAKVEELEVEEPVVEEPEEENFPLLFWSGTRKSLLRLFASPDFARKKNGSKSRSLAIAAAV